MGRALDTLTTIIELYLTNSMLNYIRELTVLQVRLRRRNLRCQARQSQVIDPEEVIDAAAYPAGEHDYHQCQLLPELLQQQVKQQ
jgi:hypothetical protein